MSYARHYSTYISGTVSGRVSYPRSDSGGSVSVTLEWQEPIEVMIQVDTNPFDHSVNSLKHHVDALSGAVVAAETVYVIEKTHSANAISKSVTDGFFTLIRSDITQQMAALKSKIDSLVMKLTDMKHGLVKIHQQMGLDYTRITERYSKVFEDLDQETRNRVSALDQDLIAARREMSLQLARPIDKGTSAIPTIFGGENSNAQTAMVAAGIRARMNQLLINSQAYLAGERTLARNFAATLWDDLPAQGNAVSLPVLYLSADDPEGHAMEEVFTGASDLSPLGDEGLQALFLRRFKEDSLAWSPMGNHPQIDRYLNALVGSIESGDATHDARVRETLLKFWSKGKPAILPI
jgi:hypothetical protein